MAELLSLKTQNEREKRDQEDAKIMAEESEKDALVELGSPPVGERRRRRREVSTEATEAQTVEEAAGTPTQQQPQPLPGRPPDVALPNEGSRQDDTAADADDNFANADDPSTVIAALTRGMELSFVKLFVVSQMQGFHVVSSPGMLDFLEACTVPRFHTVEGGITPDRVKHRVSELYVATKASFLREIGEVGGRGGVAAAILAGPTFHASFEVWTPPGTTADRASGVGGGGDDERYVGLRLHWLSEGFVLRSATLAARRLTLGDESALLRGTAEGRGQSSGDGEASIIRWTREVLEEYGVSCESLFSTVTDAEGIVCAGGGDGLVGGGFSDGSEAGRGRASRKGTVCAKLEDTRWEWSVAHMLNRVLVEVTMSVCS